MFDTISDSFFVPLASPNKLLYWECICKLFSIMDNQLSFGVERDVLVDELQYYFEQAHENGKRKLAGYVFSGKNTKIHYAAPQRQQRKDQDVVQDQVHRQIGDH